MSNLSKVGKRVAAAVAGAVVIGAVAVSPASAGTRYVDTTYTSLGACWAGQKPARDLRLYWDCHWSFTYYKWTKTWQGPTGGTF